MNWNPQRASKHAIFSDETRRAFLKRPLAGITSEHAENYDIFFKIPARLFVERQRCFNPFFRGRIDRLRIDTLL